MFTVKVFQSSLRSIGGRTPMQWQVQGEAHVQSVCANMALYILVEGFRVLADRAWSFDWKLRSSIELLALLDLRCVSDSVLPGARIKQRQSKKK